MSAIPIEHIEEQLQRYHEQLWAKWDQELPRHFYHSTSGLESVHEVSALARKLKRHHPALFASDPLYRKRAGQFVTALLPPKPRRRGRPARADVTEAIRLLKRFRRDFPNVRPAQHWARMYPAVIPSYGNMSRVQQRDAEQRLRERVRWRRRTKKRSAPHGKIPPANIRL